MTATNFEIVEADWPDDVPASKKAILNFLDSGMKSAVIKGEKDFLNNVRRAARSNEELNSKVELKMKDNVLHIRLKDTNGSQSDS